MDRVKRFFCFILVFVLVGCSDTKQLSPLSTDDTILAFGDSLTYGVGAKKGKTYPEVLSELTGLQVINAGVSGETTSKGILRFSDVLDEHQPQLIILLEGGNDVLRNHPPSQTKSNLAQMIETAQTRGVDVVLIGVPQKSLFSDSAPLYSELAEEYGLVFEGELLADMLRSAKYKSDPIHLNAEGYKVFAEGVYEVLKANGAVE